MVAGTTTPALGAFGRMFEQGVFRGPQPWSGMFGQDTPSHFRLESRPSASTFSERLLPRSSPQERFLDGEGPTGPP
jgi:hypothetical protein